MREIVRVNVLDFSEPFEGRLPFMYLDSRGLDEHGRETGRERGLVTVGVGNLCPHEFALGLPFRRPDGTRASRPEITGEWLRVDRHQEIRQYGGMAFAKITTLRLLPEDIDALVMSKVDETDRTLARMFPAWDTWPACAQLALLSWAWAVGPASPYPRMIAALRQQDFMTASQECEINPKRGTIVLRNAANHTLLVNAARVRAYHLDPDMLEWNHIIGPADEEAPTDLTSSTVDGDSDPPDCA